MGRREGGGGSGEGGRGTKANWSARSKLLALLSHHRRRLELRVLQLYFEKKHNGSVELPHWLPVLAAVMDVRASSEIIHAVCSNLWPTLALPCKNQCVLKRLDVMCASTRSSPDRLAFLPNSTNGSCAVQLSDRTGAAGLALHQVIMLTSRKNKTIEVLQQLPSRSVSLHVQYLCFYVLF